MQHLGTLELLDKIRRRPGMYIGSHSPTHLDSFLAGYSFATGFDPEQTEAFHFENFNNWIAARFNYGESTSGWARMIEDQRKDKEEALWLFFELMDEFRGIKHEQIHCISYSDQYKIDKSWRGYGNKNRPSALIIRKMHSSEPYYSLMALDDSNEVLDIRSADHLESIFYIGENSYGIQQNEWT